MMALSAADNARVEIDKFYLEVYIHVKEKSETDKIIKEPLV